MVTAGKEKLLVIGGGAAGMSAASRARRLRPGMDITVLESTGYVSTALCGIPFYLAGKANFEQLIHYTPEFFTCERNIEILLNTSVTEINRSASVIKYENILTSGAGEMPYDYLLIASGGKAAWPNIKFPREAKNLFTVRSLDDARNLKNYIEKNNPKSAVIIGIGAHGIALAEALLERNIKVTMIDSATPFGYLSDEQRGFLFDKMLEKGIEILTCERILGAHGDTTLEGLDTDSGKIIGDIFILAAGYRSDGALAEDAGLEMLHGAAIKVDDFQRTSDFNIFAAGDCAGVRCMLTGERIIHSTAAVANKTGYAAGGNICDEKTRFPGTVRTKIFTFADAVVGSVGLSESEAHGFGFPYSSVFVKAQEKPGYAGGGDMLLQMIFNTKTGKILGVQAAGSAGTHALVDTAIAVITTGMKLDELSNLDLSYNPAVSNAYSPLHYAARKALKNL
ncbi:MAG: FAD-dependent oxidoreductase [Acidobacteria bacterium]|nr:FAD-dependent oxidoreductase [Acidobacteriota bacterium]